MDLFPSFNAENYNNKYAERAGKAKDAVQNFVTERGKASPEIKAATAELNESFISTGKAVQNATDETRAAAQTAFDAAKAKLTGFLRGEVEHNGIKLDGEESKALREAFVEAEQLSEQVTKPQSSMLGMVRTQHKGYAESFKQTVKEAKFWEGEKTAMQRGKGFARAGAVVGSAIAVGDALFRSKNSEGEDRSGSARLHEAVAGGAVGAAALFARPAAMALR